MRRGRHRDAGSRNRPRRTTGAGRGGEAAAPAPSPTTTAPTRSGRGGAAAPKPERGTKLYTTLDYRDLAREFDGEAVEFAIPGTQMLVIHHRETD